MPSLPPALLSKGYDCAKEKELQLTKAIDQQSSMFHHFISLVSSLILPNVEEQIVQRRLQQ